MTAYDQYRLVTESLQEMHAGLQCLFVIEIKWTAPVWFGHLARVMNQVAGYHSVLAL